MTLESQHTKPIRYNKSISKKQFYSYKFTHKRVNHYQINNIMMDLKALERQKQWKSESTSRKEITNIKVEINEIDTE